MSLRVAFRVDASQAIGTGHVMRCLALADAVKAAGGTCLFVMRDLAGHLGKLVSEHGHMVAMLVATGCPPANPDDKYTAWLEADPAADARETLAALGTGQPWTWLIVDHYALDDTWQSAVRSRGTRIAVIDDLADRPHDCDLLIDQNLQGWTGRYDRLLPPDCVRLLGPQYALLRPEFGKLRAEMSRTPENPVRRMLVFLGGMDAPGLTESSLAALEVVRGAESRADVVIGRGNLRADSIRAWCSARPWITVHGGDSDLGALMSVADIAIGASGATTWERACLGLPTVLIVIAANQLPIAAAVAAAGAAIVAGEWRSVSVDDITGATKPLIHDQGLRVRMSKAAAALGDGEGCQRVVEVLAR